METRNVIAGLIVVATVAVLATIGIALVRLELSMIYTLALILVGAFGAALVIASLALVVKANKSGGPQERIVERHTIDGRRDPNFITLPGGQRQPDMLFPQLMRDMLSQPRLLDSENGHADDDNEWRGENRG
jgi:hypothetical protein